MKFSWIYAGNDKGKPEFTISGADYDVLDVLGHIRAKLTKFVRDYVEQGNFEEAKQAIELIEEIDKARKEAETLAPQEEATNV